MNFLILALGAVIFVACCQIANLAWHRYRGTRTTGRVIRLESEETDDGGPVFRPVVEFDMEGRRSRITLTVASAPAPYRLDQEVPVYYFPGHPGSGRVITPREFYKWIILILGCLLFLALFANSSASH